MPQTRDIALEELTASGDALFVAGTRVDAAHSLGDALIALPPLAQMPVDQAIADLVRADGAVQLQSQADQLAAHLRQRQQELDRREAQLNARLAGFEQEVRDARLWLAQRNDELNEREARLEAREKAGGGAEEGSASEEGSGFRVQKGSGTQRVPGVQGSGLGVQEGSGFSTDEGEPLLAAGETEPPADSGENARRLDPPHGTSLGNAHYGAPRPTDLSATLTSRNATEGVAYRRAEVGPEITEPQDNWTSTTDHGIAAEWEERKQAIVRQSDELDRRRVAFEEFRDKVSQMHREALELRLAAEEVQAQLRASLGLEAASTAIEAARARLAGYFRDEVAELTRRRDELEWLAGDLAEEHDRLESRCEEMKKLMTTQATGNRA